MCWIGPFGNPSWTVAWPFIAMFMVFKLAMWAAIVTTVVCGVRWLRRHPSRRCTRRKRRSFGPSSCPLWVLAPER
jgi:hypothetical protein